MNEYGNGELLFNYATTNCHYYVINTTSEKEPRTCH